MDDSKDVAESANKMREVNARNDFFDRLVARQGLVWMGQNTTHVDPSPAVLEAIAASVQRREFQVYAPPLGITELRRLILEDLGLPDMEALITDGAVSGLSHICKIMAAEISELVTTDPGWPWPEQFLASMGKPTRSINVYKPDVGYKLTASQLIEGLKPRSLIYLIDPLNPLGSSYRPDELRAICMAAKESGSFLIHDCTYRHFAASPSLAASYYPEGTITTYSFSKWLGLAGFRIGAIVAPPALAVRFAAAPPNSLGSSIVAQRAAIAGLRQRSSWLEQVRAANRASQEIVVQAFARNGLGSPLVYPSDGNFLALDVTSSGWRADDLAAALLEQGVFIRSGTYQSKFSGQLFVKVSTAVPPSWAETLAKALQGLKRG